ncbi:MAG: hypothetical protein U0528_13020 [Anaerolineae bacterium]
MPSKLVSPESTTFQVISVNGRHPLHRMSICALSALTTMHWGLQNTDTPRRARTGNQAPGEDAGGSTGARRTGLRQNTVIGRAA